MEVFRARLAILPSAWSWISPCHVWSTFARRWECLVVGVFASKVCTANGVLYLSSGFALLGFPRSRTRLLWIVVFPLRPPGCTPAEALLRLSTAVAAAYGRVPRGQWALLDADMFELIDRSTCLVEPALVGNPCSREPAPSTSSAASGRCSRTYPSRGLVEGLVLPELPIPSCSCLY